MDEYERVNYLKPNSLPMDAEPTIIMPQDTMFTEGISGKQSLDGDDWEMAEGGTVENRVGVDETELLGHWTFDEGGGTKLVDATGNHADLTINNATYADGKSGKSLNFTGTNSYATGTTSVDPGTEFTISIFVNAPSSVENWKVFMAKGATSTGDFQLYFNSKKVAFHGNGLVSTDLLSSKVVADGSWHHVAVTLKDGTLTMYIDGVADVSVSGLTSGLSNGTRPFNFGRKDGGSNCACTLDDARIYNYGLDADAIMSLNNMQVIKGDVSGDKVVDIYDLVKANNYLTNSDATDVGAGADANTDGLVNEADLTAIRKIILGIE